MSNEFYNASGAPSTGSTGSSATQRAEFLAIAAGFALLPTMLGHGNEFVVVNAGGTALTTANAATAQTLLGLAIGTNVQAWDADLDALAALDATVGILVKTAAATYARRNVVGTANEVTVTNGNGVAGNITLSLPAALTFTGKTVNGGTFNNVTVGNAALNNVTVNASTFNNVVATNATLTNPANTTQALVDAATVAVDLSAGAVCTLLATGAVGNTRAIGSPTNPKNGGQAVIIYTQDATGNRALTWNAVFKADGVNSIPPADPQANAITTYTFRYNGANFILESRESMVLLASATASGSTSLDFTNLTGFSSYLFTMDGVLPATNNANAQIRVSTDSGATFISTASYDWAENGIVVGSGSTGAGTTGDTSFQWGRLMSNSAALGWNGHALVIPNTSRCGFSFNAYGYEGTGSQPLTYNGGGKQTSASVNGIRFLMSSGNIASGTIKCYGVRG